MVDEPEDLELVRKIYEKLYPSNPEFGTEDIVALLERNTKLVETNQRFKRNEGLQPSLEEDKLFHPARK